MDKHPILGIMFVELRIMVIGLLSAMKKKKENSYLVERVTATPYIIFYKKKILAVTASAVNSSLTENKPESSQLVNSAVKETSGKGNLSYSEVIEVATENSKLAVSKLDNLRNKRKSGAQTFNERIKKFRAQQTPEKKAQQKVADASRKSDLRAQQTPERKRTTKSCICHLKI